VTDPRDQGTLCQGCCQRYRADVMLPEPLWKAIRGRHNLLCPVCIAYAIEQRLAEDNGFAAYEVQEV
jgi:hypothetical protein